MPLEDLSHATAVRQKGLIRLAATSMPGEPIESLAIVGDEVVAGSSRRLALAALEERPSKPLERRAHPEIVLEGGDAERILALAPEQGFAISALVSERGDKVWLHALRAGKKHELAIGPHTALAAGISSDGRSVIVLDDEGRALFYCDPRKLAQPSSAQARKPERGTRASIALAHGGRLWLVAAGASIDVHMTDDDEVVATVDFSPLGDEVTSALFLPDGKGFLVGTARGVVMRFELLLDRVGPSREARIAKIADAVDALLSRGRWRRSAWRVDVYDERTESDRTIFYFVADHTERYHPQSGIDWAEHCLCTGHATFTADRCVEVELASREVKKIIERENPNYDASAEVKALRATTARTRSSSTVLPGADAIKRVFDEHFASYGMALPEECLHRPAGEFASNGWDVRYRFGKAKRAAYVDLYATNRRTNDRLWRVHAGGAVDTVGTSTEGVLEAEDREFYAEVERRLGK